MRGRLVARTLNTYSPAYLLSLSLDNVSTNNRFEGPPPYYSKGHPPLPFYRRYRSCLSLEVDSIIYVQTICYSRGLSDEERVVSFTK